METDNVTISVVLWVMSAFEVYQLFALFTRNRHILKKMRQREWHIGCAVLLQVHLCKHAILNEDSRFYTYCSTQNLYLKKPLQLFQFLQVVHRSAEEDIAPLSFSGVWRSVAVQLEAGAFSSVLEFSCGIFGWNVTPLRLASQGFIYCFNRCFAGFCQGSEMLAKQHFMAFFF